MNKQSSVQWLFQKLWDTPKDKFEWQSIFLMAHEMHRKEIEEAWLDRVAYWDSEKEAEQYYTKTFGGQDERDRSIPE